MTGLVRTTAVGEPTVGEDDSRDSRDDAECVSVARSLPWKLRRLALVGFDGCSWAIALVVAASLRYELDFSQLHLAGLERILVVALLAQLFIGTLFQVYRGRYCTGSVEDAINVSAATALVGVVVFGLNLVINSPDLVPRSVPLSAALIAIMFAAGVRLAIRRYREYRSRPRGQSSRVIVFGAGNEGQRLVSSMLSDPLSGYLPVALIDDDPDLLRRRVAGVRVRGTHADIGAVATDTRADMLVVADRKMDSREIRQVVRAATDAGLGVKVLPPLTELLRPAAGVCDLRDLDITDLLGRRPVEIDIAAVADFLSNARVLVTGAGGSIGSELCRQIHRFGPAELLMLDRDESALHSTQLSIYKTTALDSPEIVLADIRDAATVADILMERRPQIVFHAAALKHVLLLEQYPEEAWKTNVIGTQNVLEAAKLSGVTRFVNISTDKAANPINVLGRSKRIGERLVADAASETVGTYVSVRFGNVLGSRGSVLTTFTEQIKNGGPITVTHPDVTRFFMTIPEAVQLVIYAAAIGQPGEVLVLDMGSPVRIVDVARQLMHIAGRSTEIVYTGLGAGEKLHEELFGEREVDDRPIHPLVSHVDVPCLHPAQLADRAMKIGAAEAMANFTTNTTGSPASHRTQSTTMMISRKSGSACAV